MTIRRDPIQAKDLAIVKLMTYSTTFADLADLLENSPGELTLRGIQRVVKLGNEISEVFKVLEGHREREVS